MNEYIKQTIDSHYSEEFIREKLYLILTSFLKYYGEDIVNLLVSTIRSTNIYLCYPHQDFQRFINLKLNISMDNYYNKYYC